MIDLSAAEARRIICDAQGFTGPLPKKVTKRQAQSAISRLGVFQLDSVNTVVRAHYMPLYSRMGPYDMNLFDRVAYEDREWFEYWAHAACVVPLAHYALFRARMVHWQNGRDIPRWWTHWKSKDGKRWINNVLAQVKERGALSAGELHEPGEKPQEGWGWRRTPGKAALEYLFALGRVAAVRRPSFERVYDLAERVIPPEVFSAPVPSREEAERELIAHAASSLGVATVAELRDYYRQGKVVKTKQLADELVADGRLAKVAVEGWKDPGYTPAPVRVPRRKPNRATFLTPFDPLIWHRARTQRVFDFDYTIEIYVPEAKRKYGYYVLPFLSEDRLAARVDLKADRAEGVLHVKGAWSEPHTRPSDVEALRGEVNRLAGFLGMEGVKFGRKGDLIRRLR